MTTSLNTTVPSRDRGEQLIHYLRKSIDCGSIVKDTVVTVGTIPANALIVAPSGIWVSADFTGGGTTAVVDVGYAADSLSSADGDAYATDLTLATTTGGFVALDELGTNTARSRSVATTVTATWTGSNTTGAFDVIIAFIPNR